MSFLGMTSRLIEVAQKSWRRIHGVDKLEQILKSIILFKGGNPAMDGISARQPDAA